jgi:hypothetical protein
MTVNGWWAFDEVEAMVPVDFDADSSDGWDA